MAKHEKEAPRASALFVSGVHSIPVAGFEDPGLSRVLEKAAEYFGLLSEPSRLRIIQAICFEERSVQEVVEYTGLPQPNVSRHLNLLHRSGVLGRRREGTSVYYRVADSLLTEVCRLVCVRLAGQGLN